MTILHPHGNIKIAFTKCFAHILSKSIFLIFKVFYPKVDTKTTALLYQEQHFNLGQKIKNICHFTKKSKH